MARYDIHKRIKDWTMYSDSRNGLISVYIMGIYLIIVLSSIDFWIFEVDEVFKDGLEIPSLNNYPFPKPIFSIISKIQ